jgi:glycosyltransferase involved in cell wall biosynthesis
MRIAFYSPQTSHLKPGLKRGGDPIFLHDLFAELERRGHEVEVISQLNVRQLWKGEVPARSLVTESIAVRKRVKEFRPDAWLVYNPSPGHPDLFGWWQRPRRYVLLAASMHQSKRMRRRWRPFLVWRPLLAWSHRRSLRRADFVIAVRPSSFDRLLQRGVAPERLGLIPYAAAIWNSMPSQEEARRRLELPLDVPIVSCATRFTSPNGGQYKTEMIIDLLSMVPSLPPHVIVVIAGDGPGRPRIEDEIDKLGIGERVHLLGEMPHADLKWFFAACDVYAYPYPRDIPFVSILEAQGCGRPVVAMRARSGELTVDVGRSGLLASTMDEFRDHLTALTNDRARCAAMGSAARQFVADFHSMEVCAKQIEELLDGSSVSVENGYVGNHDGVGSANSQVLGLDAVATLSADRGDRSYRRSKADDH